MDDEADGDGKKGVRTLLRDVNVDGTNASTAMMADDAAATAPNTATADAA